MYSDHALLALDVAIAHQDAVLHQAAIDRLGKLARGEQSSTGHGLRRDFGNALIRLGQYVQGTRRRDHAGDLAAAACALRIAR